MSNKGNLLACGTSGGEVQIWDYVQCVKSATITAHSRTVSGICFSNDGLSMFSSSSSWDPTIRQWLLKDNSLVRTFEGHTSTCYCVVVSIDDKSIISGSNELIMHNVCDGSILKKFKGHTDFVHSLALSTYNNVLISGS